MTNDRIEHQEKPSAIAKIIRNARNQPSFYVRGGTELTIDRGDQYLPLAGSVKVTRRAMLDYLKDLDRSAEYQGEHRGVELTMSLHILGVCHFI